MLWIWGRFYPSCFFVFFFILSVCLSSSISILEPRF
ncbi:unnamed protein product [Spirodela intermedia]|uniref:Uncharacterized protein n=1 Tax=Spirodela intermedia TaxID=51605 RepID=A0A7I8IM63_SPIIN|nr:unnamed protein product [Spirodela intermedia]CAA6658528.1 unnamed protein product [Spirodela intermedia]